MLDSYVELARAGVVVASSRRDRRSMKGRFGMYEASLRTAEEYWRLMSTNDFGAVGAVLADDFILEWPQSNERIRGKEKFAQMNKEYPSHGPWQFKINKIVAGIEEAVTDVSVTDGLKQDRAISFFTIKGGKIVKIVEFWPEPYKAPGARSHLVEHIEAE